MMKKKQKGFSAEYYLINDILMEWNPLGVDGPIKEEEYVPIIPSLIKIMKSRNEILLFLKEVLEKKYGISYDEQEISRVAESIYQLK